MSLVLSKEQLMNIAQIIQRASRSDTVNVQVEHTVRSVTSIARSRVMTSDSGDSLNIRIENNMGGRMSVTLNTNQIDEATLRQAVSRLDALANVQIGSARNYMDVADGPQNYLPVNLWHESTVNAMESVGETVVPQIVKTVNDSGLSGAGFVGLMERTTFVLQKDGLVAHSQETDAECSVSVRSINGKSSGWYGQAARDWNRIQPEFITQRAIDFANRGSNPSAFEPGRRTAILSPFAVAQIMRHVSCQFDAYATNVNQITGFAVRGNPKRRNKIGLQIFDRNLRMVSDPADPDGGYTPFGDASSDGIALPTGKMLWLENGVLKDLAYGIFYGLMEGKGFSQNPFSIRVEAEPGVQLMSIGEMIAGCQDGVYVNRLSHVDELDSVTGMQTGVTRDGCFAVRNGKIDRPVKNFRFTDSPFAFLNSIIAIGKAERVALGYVPPRRGEPGYAREWPRRPVIVPPIMVRDFNFSSLADAI